MTSKIKKFSVLTALKISNAIISDQVLLIKKYIQAMNMSHQNLYVPVVFIQIQD